MSWCSKCNDAFWVPVSFYRCDQEIECGEVMCRACPMCGCGRPLSEHEGLTPDQLKLDGALVWAPECIAEYTAAMEECHGHV